MTVRQLIEALAEIERFHTDLDVRDEGGDKSYVRVEVTQHDQTGEVIVRLIGEA